MHSEIVELLGDLYYKPQDIEDVLNSQIEFMDCGLLPNRTAIEGFIKSIAGTHMPRNKPQW